MAVDVFRSFFDPNGSYCSARSDRLLLKLEARFWAKVRKSEGCWEWLGVKYRNGYGNFGIGRNKYSAHRVAYTLTHGAIPPGLVVMHSCDNPGCVNPEHLKAETQRENCADKIRKNRGRYNPAKGVDHHSARLTPADVLAIVARVDAGESRKDVAIEYGVNASMVCHIVDGRKWRHVTGRYKARPDEVGRLPKTHPADLECESVTGRHDP